MRETREEGRRRRGRKSDKTKPPIKEKLCFLQETLSTISSTLRISPPSPDSIKILEAPRFSCRLGTPYMSASTREGEGPLGGGPQGILISYGTCTVSQPKPSQISYRTVTHCLSHVRMGKRKKNKPVSKYPETLGLFFVGTARCVHVAVLNLPVIYNN